MVPLARPWPSPARQGWQPALPAVGHLLPALPAVGYPPPCPACGGVTELPITLQGERQTGTMCGPQAVGLAGLKLEGLMEEQGMNGIQCTVNGLCL